MAADAHARKLAVSNAACIESLEQEVRELTSLRREDIARVAALALTVGKQTEALRAVGKALEELNELGGLAKDRIDMNVACIQKLNNVAATLGEGHQVA